jgi:hypothetical protein
VPGDVAAPRRTARVASGAAAVLRPFWAAVLTEIYLCNVCACPEILLRRNGRGQVAGRLGAARALGGRHQLITARVCVAGWCVVQPPAPLGAQTGKGVGKRALRKRRWEKALRRGGQFAVCLLRLLVRSGARERAVVAPLRGRLAKKRQAPTHSALVSSARLRHRALHPAATASSLDTHGVSITAVYGRRRAERLHRHARARLRPLCRAWRQVTDERRERERLIAAQRRRRGRGRRAACVRAWRRACAAADQARRGALRRGWCLLRVCASCFLALYWRAVAERWRARRANVGRTTDGGRAAGARPRLARGMADPGGCATPEPNAASGARPRPIL